MYKLTYSEINYDGDYNTDLQIDNFFSYLGDAKSERDADVVNMCNVLGRLVPDLQANKVDVSFMEWELQEVEFIDCINCNILDFVDHGDGWKTFTVEGSTNKILEAFEAVDGIIIYNRQDLRNDPLNGYYSFEFVAGQTRGFASLNDEAELSISYINRN